MNSAELTNQNDTKYDYCIINSLQYTLYCYCVCNLVLSDLLLELTYIYVVCLVLTLLHVYMCTPVLNHLFR